MGGGAPTGLENAASRLLYLQLQILPRSGCGVQKTSNRPRPPRVVRKAIFDSEERKRLYKEAREYLALRNKRKKFVAEQRASKQPVPSSAGD